MDAVNSPDQDKLLADTLAALPTLKDFLVRFTPSPRVLTKHAYEKNPKFEINQWNQFLSVVYDVRVTLRIARFRRALTHRPRNLHQAQIMRTLRAGKRGGTEEVLRVE